MALCATTALAGAVSRLCVRGARGRFGGVRAGTWCCVSPSSPFPPRVSRVAWWRAVPSGCPLSSLAGTPFHVVCAFRALGPLPFWWSPRVLFVCVARASRCRSPLGGVARASRVVLALGSGRAVPCAPCPSACPAPVPCSVWRAWGGGGPVPVPPTWLGVAGAAAGRPRGGAFVLAWGVGRPPSLLCPSTRWAVVVCVAGVRLWGPRSVLAGGSGGVVLVSRRRPAGFS